MGNTDSLIIISRIFGILMLVLGTLYILKMLNDKYKDGYNKGYKDAKNNKQNKYEND